MAFGSLAPHDTGQNSQESMETLRAQQGHLIAGKRSVQMFPTGTTELPLPNGMARTVNHRGAFHFNPKHVTAHKIHAASAKGEENKLLDLGPFSKPEIAQRVIAGEHPVVVMEHDPAAAEIRAAAGTHKTVAKQARYFERTKQPGNSVTFGSLAP